MHRYDASTFDHVDPALGGDDALASLVAAAHQRGLRLIGDITLNHTGVAHDWFETASADPATAERGFYFFDETEPYGYVAWHGVPTLPKLDHRSEALRERFYGSADSVVAHYLREPFGLDGWRVDCANTTARFRADDHNRDVARLTRATMRAVDGERWLVAEHCYDSADDLDGTGWHGVMAYQWFTRPLWAWLKDPTPRSLMSAVELIDLDGHGLVDSMRHLSANVPWEARQASMTMLDSHDTARFRTVVGGDTTRHLVGLAALLTMPGVPTLFAGSELGCEGDSIDTTRIPFPWDARERIDQQQAGVEAQFLSDVRALVGLRRRSDALRHGSMRWIDATHDSVSYVRESATETVLVHLVREQCEKRSFSAHDIGLIERDGAAGGWTIEFGDPDLIDVTPPQGDAGATIVLPGVPGAHVVSCARR
jgi:alpha-glucosidase